MEYVVLMPVYNAGVFLSEAINSILNQSFRNFTFLIINDCSTDESSQVINSFIDKRILYVENETNIRLAKTLNKGLLIAKQSKYIFRMDQDDISHPQRLELQIKYLNENPNVGIVGGELRTIGSELLYNYPVGAENVKASLLISNPIGHPAVAIRNTFLVKHNLQYREDIYTEDYDFWIRCSKFFDIDNLDKIVLYYRKHDGQMTGKNQLINYDIRKGREYQILYYLKLQMKETSLHSLHKCFDRCLEDEKDLDLSKDAIHSIVSQNKKILYYNQDALENVLYSTWRAALNQYRFKFHRNRIDFASAKEYFISKYKHYTDDSFVGWASVVKRLIF